jgi:hypothetical protein
LNTLSKKKIILPVKAQIKNFLNIKIKETSINKMLFPIYKKSKINKSSNYKKYKLLKIKKKNKQIKSN